MVLPANLQPERVQFVVFPLLVTQQVLLRTYYQEVHQVRLDTYQMCYGEIAGGNRASKSSYSVY